MSLPEGHTVRPMRVDDAPLIAERSAEYMRELVGFAKHSPEDVANYLRAPGFDPATDGWVVLDEAGQYVGSATAALTGGGTRAGLEVLSKDPAVARWLLETALQRVKGPQDVLVSIAAVRQDELWPDLLTAAGFSRATSVQRMRITFDGPVERPAVPEGVTVRRGAYDEQTRRAAHAVLVEAFKEQPTADPRPYDEWVASRDARSTFDWSQLTLLELDGQGVAMTECNDNFVTSDNCGYVGRLAVVTSARGRGLAKYLLHDAFATDYASGRTGTILHVDAGNPTPAVALYRSVGMRPDLISDVWRRTLPAE
jgi:GNAT superfamily N-acetyltransferase